MRPSFLESFTLAVPPGHKPIFPSAQYNVLSTVQTSPSNFARTLVHFAVDPDLVFMTTKLAGKSTFFLPLNQGDGMGAGNPPAPEGKYKTAHLWEQVWQRDSLLDLLARFIHLEVIESEIGGKKVRKENMIFPRYHQLDAVRKIGVQARLNRDRSRQTEPQLHPAHPATEGSVPA